MKKKGEAMISWELQMCNYCKLQSQCQTFIVSNLLEPSRTTIFVGNVIVCSLGDISARGGLFTLGTKKMEQNM
jgi:hypothetical protein